MLETNFILMNGPEMRFSSASCSVVRCFFLFIQIMRYSVFFLCVCTLFSASFACASDAYLKIDDNVFGQGIMRQRGRECLVITPAHVVEDAFKIEATTADRSSFAAEMLELFPGDIAVLRLAGDNSPLCRSASWSSKSSLAVLLETEKQGELRTMLADGSIRITDVDIVGYDKFRYINVRPSNKEDALAKGASGSPLYIAGQLAGMLLSVKNDIGNVIRQDALTNTLSLFFKETVPSTTKSQPQVNKAAKENGAGKKSADEVEFSGVIAKSAVNVHSLQLQENSPVRIHFLETGDPEKFTFEIWDSGRKVVLRNPARHFKGTESVTLVFTPPASDMYSMYISGTEGEGKYRFKISSIASDAQLRGEERVLQLGGSAVSGIIANGARAEYRISLEKNSPIRLSFFATGEQGKFCVELFDSHEKRVLRSPPQPQSYSGTDTFTLPFTPPQTDTYLLRIGGTEGEGKYTFKTSPIAFDTQLRGEGNVIQLGDPPAEGVVAQGAVAEYRITVEANNPIRLNFSPTGDRGKYNVEILDGTGKAVYMDPYKRYSGLETISLPFAPSKSDRYVVRIIGIEGECRYALAATRLAE
jgi:hypothetical protein